MKIIFKEKELCEKIIDNYIIADMALMERQMDPKDKVHQMEMLVENTMSVITALKGLQYAMEMMEKASINIASLNRMFGKDISSYDLLKNNSEKDLIKKFAMGSHPCPDDDNESD